MNLMAERDGIIRHYFRLGYSYDEICLFLASHHNMFVSKRHLKRLINSQGLFRRKHHSNVNDVVDYIEMLLTTSGQLHGYRWIHLKCIQHGLIVSREDVRMILQFLDPEGVHFRRRRRLRRRRYRVVGPNFIWHIDSYDKLKPYGICINGCIDGFSRQVIWLEAYHNSNDPRVIAGYYMESVREVRGCPVMVRTDFGTENSLIKRLQPFLRRNANDALAGPNSFLEGTSHHNQRIESWWSFLRKHCAQFWIDVFSHLKEEGIFTGTYLDKALIQFCFLNIIQTELYELQLEWNSHRISPSHNRFGPFGRPEIMYNIPELYQTRSYLTEVQQNEIEVCEEECLFRDDVPCDRDIFELSCILMVDNNIGVPVTTFEAMALYERLRRLVLAELDEL